MIIDRLIRHTGQKKPLLYFPEEEKQYSLAELLFCVDQFATWLIDMGINPGDVVAIKSGNSSHLVCSILATFRLGATLMPLNPSMTEVELASLISHARPKIILSEGPKPGEANITGYIRTETRGINFQNHSGSLLFYTSGTTGLPKGICLSEEQILYNIDRAQEIFQKSWETCSLCFLPLFHTFGLISDLLVTLINGGCVVVLPQFDIAMLPLIAKAFEHYPITTFSAVPLMFEFLMRMQIIPANNKLKYCISGAAPLSEQTRIGFEKLIGAPIIPAYGMTEGVCFCLCSNPNGITPGRVGFPVGIRAMVATDKGKHADVGEIGELILSGKSIMDKGYYKNTLPCYVEIDGIKWLRTGDLAIKHDDGSFSINGRIKNMIIKGGEKIYLEDVDQFLKAMPDVTDAASVRIEGDNVLVVEEFISYVVTNSNQVTETEIKRRASIGLGPLKVPTKVEFIDKIPRTATGKVKIRELQNRTSAV